MCLVVEDLLSACLHYYIYSILLINVTDTFGQIHALGISWLCLSYLHFIRMNVLHVKVIL